MAGGDCRAGVYLASLLAKLFVSSQIRARPLQPPTAERSRARILPGRCGFDRPALRRRRPHANAARCVLPVGSGAAQVALEGGAIEIVCVRITGRPTAGSGLIGRATGRYVTEGRRRRWTGLPGPPRFRIHRWSNKRAAPGVARRLRRGPVGLAMAGGAHRPICAAISTDCLDAADAMLTIGGWGHRSTNRGGYRPLRWWFGRVPAATLTVPFPSKRQRSGDAGCALQTMQSIIGENQIIEHTGRLVASSIRVVAVAAGTARTSWRCWEAADSTGYGVS